MDIYSVDIYFILAVTMLFLFVLSFILYRVEKVYSNMKYLWPSSIVPLAMALGSLLLSLYKPYASHSLLDYLLLCLFWCEFPGFIIAGLISLLLGGGWYSVTEEPIWHCVAFIISFVLNTLLIFLVIRIVLYLKKKFGSGNAPANRIK